MCLSRAAAEAFPACIFQKTQNSRQGTPRHHLVFGPHFALYPQHPHPRELHQTETGGYWKCCIYRAVLTSAAAIYSLFTNNPCSHQQLNTAESDRALWQAGTAEQAVSVPFPFQPCQGKGFLDLPSPGRQRQRLLMSNRGAEVTNAHLSF